MSGQSVPPTVSCVLAHFHLLTQEPEVVEKIRRQLPTHFFIDDPEDRYHAWCSHCREWVHLDKSRHRAIISCPKCGKVGDIIHTWRGYKHLTDKILMYVYSKSIQSPQDTVTARAVYMEYKWYQKDSDGITLPWNIVPYIVTDSYYVFAYGQWAVQARPMNNGKCSADYGRCGLVVSKSINDRFGVYNGGCYGVCRDMTYCVDNESIDEAAEGTPFWYIWSEIAGRFKELGNENAYVQLFAKAAKYPFAVETLAKMGSLTMDWLYQLTECGHTACGVLNWRGKTVRKLFRYPLTKEEKACLRNAEDVSIGTQNMFRAWQWLRARGNVQITMADIDRYGLTVDRMTKAQKVVDLNRLVKYLGRQQVKHPGHTMTLDLYTDYLRYCGLLGIDTAKKQVFMPKDLLDAHDTLMREHRQIQELRREEEMRKRSRQQKAAAKSRNRAYKKLRPAILRKYAFEADGMMIYVPEKLEELIDEGIAMHSCVGGYVDRVAGGATIVVFIRSAENPKERIGTMEISRDGTGIIQARAKYNRDLPPEAAAFVAKFKKAKIDQYKERKSA